MRYDLERCEDLERRVDLEKPTSIICTGLEEFTEEFDDTMACFQLPATGEVECAAGGEAANSREQTNYNEPTSFESNYQLADSSGPLTAGENHPESSNPAEQQINEAENYEMDLSIGSRASANTTSLSFDLQPMLKPMNSIATKNRKLFNGQFDAITSLSSDQFFSNRSENVILKPKKGTRSVHGDQSDEKPSTEEDKFNFKMSLSSQIPFDQF